MPHRVRAIILTLALATGAILSSVAPAGAAGYYRKGTFVLGGGFNTPVAELGDYLNGSASLIVAGGRHLSKGNTLQVEWNHNWLGVDPSVIDRAEQTHPDSVDIDNAYASSWSMTLNLVHRFNETSDVVPWLTGGIGYYKRNLQISQTSLVYYPPYWDPWWGWVDGGWAPGEVITGSRETSAFGFNVGGGIDFEIDSGASLFVDVRYHHAFTDGVATTTLPIMVGVRW